MIRYLLILVNCFCMMYMIYIGLHESEYYKGLIDFIVAGGNMAGVILNLKE